MVVLRSLLMILGAVLPLGGVCAGAAVPLIEAGGRAPLLRQAGQPLLAPARPLRRAASPATSRPMQASLFVGTKGGGLFAPLAQPRAAAPRPVALPPHASQVERIRHLIAEAEAGRMGYDAVQHGARRKPSRPPTQMALQEIFDWIADTPGQPHAIGRYQFIPATLRRLVLKAGIAPAARFSAEVQDRLADILLEEAGLHEIQAGRMGRRAFMNNIAKIWAGLPNATGRSHYHGYAGNKATMTWARFDREMQKVFPG